jgi:hypothetical protein
VNFSWTLLDEVRLEEGRLRFPRAPEAPGIYRFDLGEFLYVGETDRLRRRFQHYRTPGPTQHTNVRINGKMIECLKNGFEILVAISTDATVEIDGAKTPLDLTLKSSRLLVESAALTELKSHGVGVENL